MVRENSSQLLESSALNITAKHLCLISFFWRKGSPHTDSWVYFSVGVHAPPVRGGKTIHAAPLLTLLGIMNMGEKMSSAASLLFFSFYSNILLTLKTALHQFCLLMFFYIINHIMQNSVVNSLSYWGSGISVIPWTLSSPWRDASKAVFMEKVLKRTPCWWDVKLLCIPKFLLKRYTVLTYSHSFIFTLFWDAIEAAELNL